LPQLRRKPGILITRLVYIFLQHKKNSDFKINIQKINLFLFKKKSKEVRLGHLRKPVTRLDTKKGGAQVKFKESWRALFK
jgi:hypothetical protein